MRHKRRGRLSVATFRIPLTNRRKWRAQSAQTLSPKVIIPIHLGIRPRAPFLRISQSAGRFIEKLRNDGNLATVAYLQEGESWSDEATAGKLRTAS